MVVNNRLKKVFASARLFRQSERRLIEVGLRAVEILAAGDQVEKIADSQEQMSFFRTKVRPSVHQAS